MSQSPEQVYGFVSGAWQTNAPSYFELHDKYDQRVLAHVGICDAATVREATQYLAQHRAAAQLSSRQRATILVRAAELIREQRTELIALVQGDTGFARGDAEKEVDRASETLILCAEEAKRLVGTLFPVHSTPGGELKHSYSRLDPIGIVCALTPFNSPLNTVAHKIGPAIAAGNSVILKPASQTPRTAAALVRILLQAGLPAEAIALVFGRGAEIGSTLTAQPEIGYFAFTGSTAVGTALHAAIGLRPAQLEMGSIASTIVCADANLTLAAQAIIAGALRKSGQVCTSVQRVYADAAILPQLTEMVRTGMRQEVAGDPAASATTVGPLISPAEAVRVTEWITDAISEGAVLECGGSREGSVVQPTLLTAVPAHARIMREELFGPAVVIASYTTLSEAYTLVNDTEYGLAAGIFTENLATALAAADQVQVGAFYVNQTSASRTDAMMFTGVKASGFGGAEGPAFAIRDMSIERVVTISR